MASDYRLELAGPGVTRLLVAFDGRKVTIGLDPDSPWVLVDFEPAWGEEATPENGERKFAIWRETQAVYDVLADGTVADDPIPFGEERAVRVGG